MASCTVQRDNKGNIQRVNNSEGVESSLFNSIIKHPIVESPDIALNIYKNVFTEKTDEGAIFTHRTNQGLTESYKQALSETPEGGKVEIGFYTPEKGFQSVISFTKTSNKDTERGFINNLIENGLIAEQKERNGNEYYYAPDAVQEIDKAVKAVMIQEEAFTYLGVSGVQMSGHLLKLRKTKDRIRVVDRQGNSLDLDPNELDSQSYEELSQKYENATEIVTEREYTKARQAYGDKVDISETPQVEMSEEELQMRMLNLLNKMGVKTLSISEYIKNYKTRNGVNPSATALADIANQIVAFKNEEISTEDLLEETAHFIVEALPQDQTRDVLRNIHRSEEWAEFSEVYREIYRDEYSGDNLEDAVRREVLGKIVAKSLKENFSTENKSETQQSFIKKALEFVTSFFNRINNLFKPQYKTELDNYLKNIEDLAYAENIAGILNTENFHQNKYVLYSAPNNGSPEAKIANKAKLLVENLQDKVNALLRAGEGSAVDKRKLEKLNRDIEAGEQVRAVADMVTMANHDLKKLKKSFERVEKGNSYFFSNEENIVYQNLIHNVYDTLQEIKVLVSDKKKDGKDWAELYKRLDQSTSNIADFKYRVGKSESDNISRLAQDIMDKHNLPEEERKYVIDWLTEAQHDTTWLHATFGQSIHARDGLVNILGSSIRGMYNQGNIDTTREIKILQKAMRDSGVTAKDMKQFFDKGYLLNETNFSLFNDVMDYVYAENYIEVTGSKDSVDTIIEKKRNGGLEILTSSQEADLRNKNKQRQSPFVERVFKKEYYDNYEKSLKEKGIQQVTKDVLGSIQASMAVLKAKAIEVTEDGKEILNFQNLSPADREEFYALHRYRLAQKSYTNERGELKSGLVYVYDNEGNIQKDEKGKPVIELSKTKIPSEDAIVAYDINILDKDYDEQKGEQSLDLFYKRISEVDNEFGREEALNFLKLNAYLGFSDKFWESLNNPNSLMNKLEAVRETNPEVGEIIEKITELNSKMRGILRLYQKKNNPSETSTEDMDQVSRDTVKEIQESLTYQYRKASAYVKNVEDAQTDNEVEASSDANEAYLNDLAEEEIDITEDMDFSEALSKIYEEADSAKKHMTTENSRNVAEDLNNLEKLRSGERSKAPLSIQRIMDTAEVTIEELQDNDIFLGVAQTYIRSKLLPYYKKFTPATYDVFTEDLSDVTKDIVETLKTSADYNIEIKPNYSFFDKEENEDLNPNYKQGYRGGYIQAKISEPIDIPVEYKGLREKYGNTISFKSSEFQDKFGEVSETGASKNQELFKAYEALKDFYFKSKMANGMTSSHNFYELPQIRKGRLERATSFLKNPSVDAIKNAFKDFASFTEDDMAKGDTRFGQTVKVIPKMYTQKLENPEDISTEVFYAVTLYAKEAYTRRARVDHYGNIMSLYDRVLTRDYSKTGKATEATNTVKMVKSMIDYNMFGIKETKTMPVDVPILGTVDMAKIARNILSFIKFRNLGLNVVIPMTSYLTGGVFQKIELLQQDYLHKRSQKLGTAEFRKLATDSIKEIGNIDTTAKLNVLGQFFRAFDLKNSLENSNYGWVARNLPRTAMGLHTMANFPIYGKTLMGVLHDYRVVDGKVINFNSFKNINKTLTKKEIEEKWKDYEQYVIYKYIDVKDGNVEFDKKALGDLLNKEGTELDDEISSFTNTIQQYVTNINEFIDGQISEDDRVHAHRDAMLNYFMTHRGWLSIATSKRFKHRHFNAATGLVEEGSYRSVWNFTGDYLKEFDAKNISGFIKSGKDIWGNADEIQRRNMKRVMIEMSLFNSLFIIGFLLNKLADDDENKDLFTLQASNYLMMRTLNEMSSSQLALGRNYSEIIDSPFVGWSTIQEMTNVLDVFSGEEVKHGSYRGMTESRRFITKLLPGAKQIHDLQNLNQTKNTYFFFNRNNFKYTPLGTLDWEKN